MLAISFWLSRMKIVTNDLILPAYIFALFMSILPIMHLSQTHRHTFLYLTPVWVAMRFVYTHNKSHKRSRGYLLLNNWLFVAYSFLPIYFLDIFNVNSLIGLHFGSEITSSLIMLTEPIWLNLVLLISILCYGLNRKDLVSSFH